MFLAVLPGKDACTNTTNPFINLGEVSADWQRLYPSCSAFHKRTNSADNLTADLIGNIISWL